MPKTFVPKTSTPKNALLFLLLLLTLGVPALAGNLPLPLETLPNKTFADVQAQAKAEATGGPIWGNAPDPSLLPVHQTFTGTVTADATMTKLAIFSDDGADVYVDGTLVWSSKDKPQALPDIASSLHELPVTLSAGSHSVQIDYSNVIYTVANAAQGVPPDIDGCTLYEYGASTIPVVKVTTGDWQPNPAAVGQAITSAVSASASPSPQAPSGHSVSQQWTWATGAVYQSADGTSGSFTKYTGNYGIGWDQGAATTQFRGVFYDPGYYIIKVIATVAFHDDTAGSNIGPSYSGFNYIGGSAGDLAAGASAAPARLAPAAAGTIKGVPVKTVPVTGLQYKDPTTGNFVPVSGTLYVLKNTTVTFKAVSSPATLPFPAGQPTWSGTSGASGTGQTLAVGFATVSTSTTDYKTVMAASAKPAADTANSVNVVVVDLTLKQVSFGGTGFHAVLNDIDGTAYNAPQWQDNSTPPNANVTDTGDKNYPLCYTQGSKASVSVSLVPVPAIPSGSVLVTNAQLKIIGTYVTLPHYSMTATVATVDTTGVSIKDAPLADAFPATVAYIPKLSIQWRYINGIDKIGGNDQSYQNGGISDHKVYVVLSASPPSALQTVLETACVPANGKSTPAEALPAIWSTFTGLSVKRASDSKVMQYWGPISSSEPELSTYDSAEGLVKNADGRCTAWANFLVYVFGAQDIAAEKVYIGPNFPAAATLTKNGQTYQYSSSEPQTLVVDPNDAAQGVNNTHPSHHEFGNHWVIRVTGVNQGPALYADATGVSPLTSIYDPSYGFLAPTTGPGRSPAHLKWEDHSMSGYGLTYQNITTPSLPERFTFPDSKGSTETTWNPND